MKKNALILLLLAITIISCEDKGEEPQQEYLVATPIFMSLEDFQNGVDILPPQPVTESGKIYAYQNYIFVNDLFRGVHVIDNSDPNSPNKQAFIEIPGNVDISVKDNFLFADSLTDLVVLDISDLSNIKEVNRLANVLQDNVVWPAGVDFFEFGNIDPEREILIGWEVETQLMTIQEVEERFMGFPEVFAESTNDSGTGEGGSMARFKIVGDHLYAVDSHNINVFDIANLEQPMALEDVFIGFDIETIFNQGEHLFIGSMQGMYVYNISSPGTPAYVSEFRHGTACDPVVVDGDYAYVTLRGGNLCGAIESGLFIVDISLIESPVLAASYPMDGPYGLGIKDEKLFVCDGASGLKVYDKSDVLNLVQLDHFQDVNTFDVIPLDQTLLMVGEGVLYQYAYEANSISLLSTISLN